MDIKLEITNIEIYPDGTGAVLTVSDPTITPFEVSTDYLTFNPTVGGFYTVTDGVEGFSLT